MRVPAFLFVLLAFGRLATAEPLDLSPVKKWIASQEDFRAVTADFTQTRALRTLRSPLASQGKLWFSAPDSFRWELGQPAKTIVLRQGNVITIIQPGKKKAERTPAGTLGKQAGAQGFGMMKFPLAHDFADFQRQFEPLAIHTEGTRCHLEVLPRDAAARQFLAALKLDFDTATGQLLAFELATREGSSLRSEFSNVRVNPKINPAVFDYDLAGFEIVDAQK